MTTHLASWLARRKWIVAAMGLPVLVAAWWAFRPEKLWINQRVNEPAPFASTTQPLFTGRLQGGVQPVTGRATVYKSEGGREYLRLTGLTGFVPADLRVALVRTQDDRLDSGLELGLLTAQSDQDFDVPASVDLAQYHAVTIYDRRSHAVFGMAQLERF